MTVENFYHFAKAEAVLIAAIELNSKTVLSEYSKTSLSKRLKWFWCLEDGIVGNNGLESPAFLNTKMASWRRS